MTTPSAPGWYEDPDDASLLRYFDGVVWSAHTTPRHPQPAPVVASPPEQPVAAPVPPSTPEGPAAHPDLGPQQGWSTPPGWERPAPGGVRLPDGDVVAEWWRRLLGWVVDTILTGIVAGIASLPLLGDYVAAVDDFVTQLGQGNTSPDLTGMTNALADIALPVGLIQIGVGLVYSTLFLVWRGATPGKMLLGTVVRPASAPGRVSVTVALRRQAIGVVSDLLRLNPLMGLLGFVLAVVDPAWLLRDPRRQALHDKVADTVVVLRRR
ncbi:RDD family protein [Phycicoccus sp.]|uniref:RDD family protein n=1 Tax=Phycicoccus sp. TaxID=1902410 RepID=UPI002B55D4D0|nr:RDD family protein [Phycicoccus sp.]HMM93931.1 RDD family protein [Phycicoccus sp.]